MKHVRYNANEQHNLCISSLPINSLLGVFHANALQSMCGYRRGQSLPNNSNSHSLINNWISREKKYEKVMQCAAGRCSPKSPQTNHNECVIRTYEKSEIEYYCIMSSPVQCALCI